MTRMRGWVGPVLVGVAVLPGGVGAAQAAEEGTVNALASWQGQGRVFKIGERQALFVGGFVGILFVENNQGALHAARILCPGSLDIDLGTGNQAGEGRCIITDRAGDRVFARWTCVGSHSRGAPASSPWWVEPAASRASLGRASSW